MRNHKVSRLLVSSLVTFILASACGQGPFTIKHEDFSATDVCDGEGTIEYRMVNGRLAGKGRDALQLRYLKDGGIGVSFWCHGLRHAWIGTATHAGYVFESDPDDPLQFVVDRRKGYYYEQGKGTVITPDGKAVTLP